MKLRLAVASGLMLVGVLAAGGWLSGWTALWHAAAGRQALAEARARRQGPELFHALGELSTATAIAPLSARYRADLRSAIGLAIERLGPGLATTLAPAETVPRLVFVEELWEVGATGPAADLLATVESAPLEAVAVLPNRTLWRLADHLLRSRRCVSGIAIVEAALARIADPWGLELAYARCLLRAGAPERAVPVLERLLAVDATARWPRFVLGEAELAAGRLEAARATAEALTVDEPDFYYAWHLRGRVESAAGDWQHAAESFERALSLRPANAWLRVWVERLRQPVP